MMCAVCTLYFCRDNGCTAALAQRERVRRYDKENAESRKTYWRERYKASDAAIAANERRKQRRYRKTGLSRVNETRKAIAALGFRKYDAKAVAEVMASVAE